MIFFASDAMCHFRGGLVQCFGARAERTAGGIRVIFRPHTARLRRLCGVIEMWHLRCHGAYNGTQGERDNACVY